MASKMGYYNVEEFTKQKRDEIKEIKVPPKANILAAADHIKKGRSSFMLSWED
jgi:hypothetical protein